MEDLMQYQSENTTNILRAISKARQEFKTIENQKKIVFLKIKVVRHTNTVL